jgi:hypothetical protein
LRNKDKKLIDWLELSDRIKCIMAEIVFETVDLVTKIFESSTFSLPELSVYRLISKTCDGVCKSMYDKIYSEKRKRFDLVKNALQEIQTILKDGRKRPEWFRSSDFMHLLKKLRANFNKIVVDLHHIIVHDAEMMELIFKFCAIGYMNVDQITCKSLLKDYLYVDKPTTKLLIYEMRRLVQFQKSLGLHKKSVKKMTKAELSRALYRPKDYMVRIDI